ncbi:T9SS type A sorting domain-containing protein [Flavobacterium sp. RHBU_24]|uniref:type IX secretion system anionic LPS delivery protein PorZ n=1 Tax=Flavobacterium sp. RHBU_24 TaxID=3391185 RepID=UPI0039854A76
MKLRFASLLLLLSCMAFAQNQQWGSYFSYTNIVDLAQNNGRVYAAAESAVFSQNVASGELKTITSVDGLKAELITAIFYSPSTQKTLVGNSNGLLLVVNTDGTITTKIDIVQEATVPNSVKKINHFCEHNGIIYISCDFGITTFNPQTMLFGDTYYMGENGSTVAVRQTAVYNGYIYAVTANGVRRAAVTNPNLNDFSQWQSIFGGGWKFVLAFNDAVFAVADWNAFYRIETGVAYEFAPLGTINDLRAANGYMVVTQPNRVLLYNSSLQQEVQINTVGEPAVFTKATLVGQNIYIGTSDKGVFSVNRNTYQAFNITPNGPLRSNIFSLEKGKTSLWAVFGGFNFQHTGNDAKYGVSKYTANAGWENIPYETLRHQGNTTHEVRAISDITINPDDEKQVYFSAYNDGLLKLNDMVPEILYTQGNSGLENQQVDNSLSIRVIGATFDDSGALWVMNHFTKEPLKVLRGNTWSKYSFEDVFGAANVKEVRYERMVIDRNGTKWIPTLDYGLVAYNETLGPKFIKVTENEGLPINYVKSLAIDLSGRLWIGTVKGLRVIYSTQRFIDDTSLEASQVIIEEDGVAQELMYEQAITDIEVDGANNKWFATAGAGAFLVSPDGQQTLYHFTKENSPLPSNNINDIAIDSASGEVFFATDRGMVSFKGTSTEGADDLAKVYVYPNPVRPNFNGDVKISNLTDSANVKITDIEGNLVFEATSEGGTVLWDTTAFGKYKVRTGVYMIFISTEDATETKVKKVMVVR